MFRRYPAVSLAVVLAIGFALSGLVVAGWVNSALTAAQVDDDASPVERAGPTDPAQPENERLIRSLRRLTNLAPSFERDGNRFDDALEQAETALAKSKRSNAEAVRQANRQVRVFNSHHSPNVILIAVENLAPGDLSCYGQQRYTTPTIDALAASGVRLTDYYSASTVDRLAWAALWSGISSAGGPDDLNLTREHFLLPEMMWQANYNTTMIGRLMVGGLADIGGPRANGFEHTLGFRRLASPWELYPETLWADGQQVRIPGNVGDDNEWLVHEIFAREAVLYMKRHCNGRPFFLTLSLEVSARPNDPQADDVEGREDWTALQRSHAASVQRLDQMLEVLLDYLRTPESPRNTIIVLTGVDGVLPDDAGVDLNEFFNRTGLYQFDETRLGEGNLRVPLIIFAGKNRHTPAYVSDQPAGTWDLLPTLATWTDTFKRPKHIHGDSLAKHLIQDPQAPVAGDDQDATHLVEPLAWKTNAGAQAVRVGPWKAIQNARDADWEIYNLEKDPAEEQDVAADHAELIRRIEQSLK